MTVTHPQPPRNAQVVSPLVQGVLDVRWDDPALQEANSGWRIVGVNVYRSDSSDRGPYRRLNTYPVGGCFYRDSVTLVRINREVIPWDTGWLHRGEGPNVAQWVLRTRFPLHKPNSMGLPGDAPDDVQVMVDGKVAWVRGVFGSTREITLDPSVLLDPRNERWSPSPLPLGVNSEVTVDYFTLTNQVQGGVDKRHHYRLTTVAHLPGSPELLRETPLDQCAPVSDGQIETLDYIWREATRRNRWILEQGGERVKLYTQKTGGALCLCGREMDARSREYSGQPSNRCRECYGTGWVGGYEGPYEILVAPDDSEKRISQTPNGRRKEQSYEVWTGYTPVISQRDFLVKQNNDRFSVGPVRRPSNRGNVLQQHFNIAYLDSQDIRYRVPLDPQKGSPYLPWPQTRYSPSPHRETYDRREDAPWPVQPDAVTPMMSDHSTDGAGQERARTGAGENISRNR